MNEWRPPTAAEKAEMIRLQRWRKGEMEDAERCRVAEAMLNVPPEADFAVIAYCLSAIGDEEAIVVVRNPNIVRDEGKSYAPVLRHIEANGLELADRRTFNAADRSYHEASWWMNRGLMRDGLLSYGPSPLGEIEKAMS